MNTTIQRLERIKELLKIAPGRGADTQLAQALGISKSTLSTWKIRDSLPFAVCERFARDYGRSLDWIMTGQEVINERRSSYSGEDRIALIKEWLDDVATNGTIKDRHWLERQFEYAFPSFLLWLEARHNRLK